MLRHIPRLPWALVFLVYASIVACGADPEPDRPPDVYRVRGIVSQLPQATRGAGELSVRHEALPDFKSSQGEVVGMESMTMPFPLADPALADSLAAGDKIEMEFEVRWDSGNPLSITAIEKLPSETSLSFETED